MDKGEKKIVTYMTAKGLDPTEITLALSECFALVDNDGVGDLHFQPPYGTVNWIDFVSVFRTMELEYRDFMTVETPPWPGGGYRQLIGQVSALLNHLEERLARQEQMAAQAS